MVEMHVHFSLHSPEVSKRNLQTECGDNQDYLNSAVRYTMPEGRFQVVAIYGRDVDARPDMLSHIICNAGPNLVGMVLSFFGHATGPGPPSTPISSAAYFC